MDQRLANPRQNNLQTSTHCLNRGMLLKMLVFGDFQLLGRTKKGWGWRRLKALRGGRGGRERHGGVRWGDRGEEMCLSALLLRSDRGRKYRSKEGGAGRKVFVGGEEKVLWEDRRGGRILREEDTVCCATITMFTLVRQLR